MSAVTLEWVPILVSVIAFIGVITAEILWLVRKGWARAGRALAYVLITDLLSFCIGSFFVFVISFWMMMLVFGPLGNGSNAPEVLYWVGLLLVAILPPLVFVTSKRIFLSFLKMRAGKPAWIYALVGSLLILLVVLIPPPLSYYLIGYLSKWK